MPTKLINPMNEAPLRVSMPPARLRSLQGKTVGLLDISKTGGNLFLDRLEQLLRERFGLTRADDLNIQEASKLIDELKNAGSRHEGG